MVTESINILDKGAESIIIQGELLGKKVIVKYRIKKPYRHPKFDEMFRKTRTKTEAKVLSELCMNNVNVPTPLIVDLKNSVIVMEYINGEKLSDLIDHIDMENLKTIAYKLGYQIGIMHSLNIYHGDLTLANVLINNGKVYIIDFGLAGYSRDVEEYAMDIHLMKKSLLALAPDKMDVFMEKFIKGYSESYQGNVHVVLQRVEEIRLRGRYVEERLKKKILREKYAE
ncbi:MAG: Kae1-associated kinase Bud32 [Staphylothermus sp.]|nr:Kae1-associated kinase Bud32 [Staphylothermus sp.]